MIWFCRSSSKTTWGQVRSQRGSVVIGQETPCFTHPLVPFTRNRMRDKLTETLRQPVGS